MNFLKKIFGKYLTNAVGKSEITETRAINGSENREMDKAKGQGTNGQEGDLLSKDRTTSAAERLIIESFHCPYCGSTKFVKRGFRQKKREKIQLYLCSSCQKTFTPYSTKGKRYPMEVVIDAISIYNLGYSLEQTCRIVSQRNNFQFSNINLQSNYNDSISKNQNQNIENLGIENSLKTENCELKIFLPPSSLTDWLAEFSELCRFSRMRSFALKKYSPKEMVISATLAHRQLYRYRFHRAKCELVIKDDFKHRRFGPLQEFLEMVPTECPHQYFSARGGQAESLRASEAPLTFSKTQMIVRAKQNYANKLCAFALQGVKERKGRHEALQKFMLCNDSVTVATEVPVYITRDDIEHLKTQLGFEIYSRVIPDSDRGSRLDSRLRGNDREGGNGSSTAVINVGTGVPKLITGHIDILQIRNGQIHIMDFKPHAEKERPIEQLTLYAMALSRLTGLRLFEFKCAWFDEKDYFEFYPLHVLHKPKKGSRRRKVKTDEGVYKINQDRKKILSIRPIPI